MPFHQKMVSRRRPKPRRYHMVVLGGDFPRFVARSFFSSIARVNPPVPWGRSPSQKKKNHTIMGLIWGKQDRKVGGKVRGLGDWTGETGEQWRILELWSQSRCERLHKRTVYKRPCPALGVVWAPVAPDHVAMLVLVEGCARRPVPDSTEMLGSASVLDSFRTNRWRVGVWLSKWCCNIRRRVRDRMLRRLLPLLSDVAHITRSYRAAARRDSVVMHCDLCGSREGLLGAIGDN